MSHVTLAERAGYHRIWMRGARFWVLTSLLVSTAAAAERASRPLDDDDYSIFEAVAANALPRTVQARNNPPRPAKTVILRSRTRYFGADQLPAELGDFEAPLAKRNSVPLGIDARSAKRGILGALSSRDDARFFPSFPDASNDEERKANYARAADARAAFQERFPDALVFLVSAPARTADGRAVVEITVTVFGGCSYGAFVLLHLGPSRRWTVDKVFDTWVS